MKCYYGIQKRVACSIIIRFVMELPELSKNRLLAPEFDLPVARTQSNALLDAVCKGCSTGCTKCSIEGKQPTKCVEAPGHTSAIGVNATLESLLIEPGYWRATGTSVHIFACYNPDACLGGVTGAEGYCRKGYEGPCE